MTKSDRWFVGLSWIPIVTFVVTIIYIRGFDGWVRWAAAPLLIPAVLLSFVLGLTGMLFVRRAKRQKRPTGGLVAATLVSGLLAFWFMFRAFIGWFSSSFLS